MRNWVLHVKNFGKIKSADVEVKPLTLFVGDNNSGKSYLLSLIWSLKNYATLPFVFVNYEKELKNSYYESLKSQLKELLNNDDGSKEFIVESQSFLHFLNNQLKNNKNFIIRNIFNFEKISIDEISISMDSQFISLNVVVEHLDNFIYLKVKVDGRSYVTRLKIVDENAVIEKVLFLLFQYITMDVFGIKTFNGTYYFPAARTGFVLSRNVINQKSRRSIFDIGDEDLFASEQYFTKPILHFLDMLEISGNGLSSYKKMVNWIEQNLSHGTYSYVNEQSRELGFIPNNRKQVLPMRASSAVVTELSPLIILLKGSNKKINTICYEEPEMCLHPQLQLCMGRCLIRLLRLPISIIATTHSDIILQHISNMCILAKNKNKDAIMQELGYDNNDLLDISKVAVYQFTESADGSKVDRILPKDDSFQIPTFTNALDRIVSATLSINDK